MTPRTMLRTSARYLLAVALFLTTPAVVLSQGTQSGVLSGTVTDDAGGPMPGVTVTVTSPVLLAARTVFTGANGDYAIRGLPPGAYKVSFALDGMITVEQQVPIEVGRTARADSKMELAEFEDQIVVTDQSTTPLDDVQGSNNFTADVVDLLAIDRTPDAVAELAPGVNDRSVLNQLSISGGIGYDNLIMVDGVDVTFGIFGNTSGPFPSEVGNFIEEAIQDTQVITSRASAEFGRFSGGVINTVTKRGGNDFKGSLRADLSNPSWVDETPIEDELGIKRESNQNELYSATLGGPIVQDRLWFFLAAATTDRSDPSVFAVSNLPRVDDFENTRVQLKLTGEVATGHTVELSALDNESKATGVISGFELDPRSVDRYKLPHESFVARYTGVIGSNTLIEAQYSTRDFQTVGVGGSSTRLQDSPFYDHHSGGFFNAPVFSEYDPPQNFEDTQLAGSVSWFLSSERRGSHDLKVGFELFETSQVGGLSQSATDFFWGAPLLLDDEGIAILDGQGRLQPVWETFVNDTYQYVADPDARLDLETTALYVTDSWRLNDHWSFSLGFRYENVSGNASDAGKLTDVDSFLPRLAATYDPRGDGRFRFTVGYAEYSGKANAEIFKRVSSSRNPDEIGYYYAGPSGVGLDFAPGFDLDNYIPFYAVLPNANVSYDNDLGTARSEEITLSAGMQLARGGFIQATYIERTLTDVIESFTLFENGTVTVEDTPVGPLTLDQIVLDNSDLPQRDYRAIEFAGRYRLSDQWTIDGNWTWQLENHGNFVGENRGNPATQSDLGDFPEILVPQRNFPAGRLPGYQEHRLRLWTTYDQGLGRAGHLGAALIYSYDSPLTYSLSAFGPVSETQLARDPGYALPPRFKPIFFGERGSEEFNSTSLFDLALTWFAPAWKSIDPWLKVEIRNVFNSSTARTFNTSISPDFGGPVDADGIPTAYVEGPGFGKPSGSGDFVRPREYLMSIGIRFN